MAKQYPMSVEVLHEVEGNCILGYYSKGHHDHVEFVEALIYDVEVLKLHPNVTEDQLIDNTVHLWAKLVPWATGGMLFVYSQEYKKGYFPVTQFEF